jgi:hydrogenase maturation factor
VYLERIYIPEVAQSICNAVTINPLEAISSGALLIAVEPSAATEVIAAVRALGTQCVEIGCLTSDRGVWMNIGEKRERLEPPDRDAIAVLFEQLDTPSIG